MQVHCQDETIRIFETVGFNEIITLPGHQNGSNCSLLVNETLISGGKDGQIKKWDWRNEKLESSLPAHYYAVYDLISLGSNENRVLISCSRDKTIKVWDSNLKFIEED